MKTIGTMLLLLLPFLSFAHSFIKPSNVYFSGANLTDTSLIVLHGSARCLEINGRKGFNTIGIKSVFELKKHTINDTKGSIAFWITSLEDLSQMNVKNSMTTSNKYFENYTFLSDCKNVQDLKSANFKFVWRNDWYPNMYAIFTPATYTMDAFAHPHSAFVEVGAFSFVAKRWYQIILSWDKAIDSYKIYIDGVRVAEEDKFYNEHFRYDKAGKSLFMGNPTFCFSNVEFFDSPFNDTQAYSKFRNEVIKYDQKHDLFMQYTYMGKGRKKMNFNVDKSWICKLNLTLNKQTDLDSMYLQGNPTNVSVTPEGTILETAFKKYSLAVVDSQMYLWSKKSFEGDLYVEYDFKLLREGGLSLFVAQATGMNGEDFMKDYPLRTSGTMGTIIAEDVRNYHWEYYREMSDTRNDVASYAIIKNPSNFPLSYGCSDRQMEQNVWHKLQFLQKGNKIIGAIDGIIMNEATDSGFNGHGPILNSGHIAIRCMVHTKILIRNLKVFNKSDFTSVPFKVAENE